MWIFYSFLVLATHHYASGQECTTDACISCKEVGTCQDGSLTLSDTCSEDMLCYEYNGNASCTRIEISGCNCTDSTTCKLDPYNANYLVICNDPDNPQLLECTPPEFVDLSTCGCSECPACGYIADTTDPCNFIFCETGEAHECPDVFCFDTESCSCEVKETLGICPDCGYRAGPDCGYTNCETQEEFECPQDTCFNPDKCTCN